MITELQNLYQQSLLKKPQADAYFKSRGLTNHSAGYLDLLRYRGRALTSCILIPIRNSKGELIACEARSTIEKQHYKLTTPTTKYLIYNIENALNTLDYVVIAEGIMDCETLTQHGYNAVSPLRASAPAPVLHLLTTFKSIYLMLDNDPTGIAQTKRILDFYRTHYPELPVTPIDYYAKDPNDLLLTNAHGLLTIKNQIDYAITP